MKKTLIDIIPYSLPASAEALIRGAEIYDSSSSPEARVYYVKRGEGFYLKRGERGTLRQEAEMGAYFHSLGLAPEVVDYVSGENDWLITKSARGLDATEECYTSEPKRLAILLGESLRQLHEINPVGCPVGNRLETYLALAHKNYETDNYDKSYFPDSFGYASGEEAMRVLSGGEGLLTPEVLIHGDYCLPNVILDGWRVSEYIDLGAAGISDRHVDLFWGGWTLEFNLHTNAYCDLFFDAYGRDKVDFEKLKIVAAAEVFG